MNVRHLIEELENMPDDAEVVYMDKKGNHHSIDGIEESRIMEENSRDDIEDDEYQQIDIENEVILWSE